MDIIVSTCVILHNMIMEARKGAFSGDRFGGVRVTYAKIEDIIDSDSGAFVGP